MFCGLFCLDLGLKTLRLKRTVVWKEIVHTGLQVFSSAESATHIVIVGTNLIA